MKKLLIFALLSLSLTAQQTTKAYGSIDRDEIAKDMNIQIKNGWKVVDSVQLVTNGGYNYGMIITYEKSTTTTTTITVDFKDIPKKIAEVSKVGWTYVDKIQNPTKAQQFILIFKKEN